MQSCLIDVTGASVANVRIFGAILGSVPSFVAIPG